MTKDDMVIIPYTTAMERVDGIDYLRMIYVVGKDENGIASACSPILKTSITCTTWYQRYKS